MNIREAMRKPRKTAPQLLSIPNRDEVLAAFKRAQTFPLDLISIEFETHPSVAGDCYKLVAFVRNPSLNAQHIMPSGDMPSERQLIGAAEVLAQSLSIGARRKAMK
jgi:hypothetical protein